MARRKTIKPIDLDKAMREILDKYGNDVYSVLDNSVDEISREAVQKLHEVAKFNPSRRPTGAYSRDWTATDEKGKRLLEKKTVIHNEKHYRLTHLLENGHVSRNGTGRTFGRVPAYPHIKPVNDWVVETLQRKVEDRLRAT